MKKFNIIFIVITCIILIVGAFYWYELRPSQVRKACNQWKEDSQWNSQAIKIDNKYWRAPYDTEIERCLGEHGVKE